VTGAAAYLSSQERRGSLWAKVKALLPGGGPPNDEALADKVRSEVFRPEDAPKGSVNVNVQNGIVYLRGQLDDQARIEELVRRARGVRSCRIVWSAGLTSPLANSSLTAWADARPACASTNAAHSVKLRNIMGLPIQYIG